MKLRGLTVCVDYSDLLIVGAKAWAEGLDDWIIITTPDDEATQALATYLGVTQHQTVTFYQDGAVFNKAAAMSEVYAMSHWPGWWVFIDADLVPPRDWRACVEAAEPKLGTLYGCPRRLENGQLYAEGELAGYFQLFHAYDPHAQRRPLLDCTWQHAGGYDSEFQARWQDRRVWIPGLEVMHLGEPGRNWWRRGNAARMDEMLHDRRRHGGIAPYERRLL